MKLKKMYAWENEYVRVTILGDVATNGSSYAEAHIVYKKAELA